MSDQISKSRERLTLGPVQILLADGDVRYVRVGAVEVLRRIYVAVRDRAWRTIPGAISDYRQQRRGDGLAASYRCEHRAGEIDFAWNAAIDVKVTANGGQVDAHIAFTMDGAARSDFLTNRTGLCVLHPIAECAGQPCAIERPDGTKAPGQFPELIRPDQPFTNIRAMEYAPAGGLRVRVDFEGEVFETEDQRNWADGSYKTYCRMLEWGIPYELKRGQRVHQKVIVRVTGRAPSAQRGNTITLGEPCGKLPAIGVSLAAEPISVQEASLIEALNLSHVRLDVRNGQPTPAAPPGLPIELALHLPGGSVAPVPERLARGIVYRDGRPFATAEDVERLRQMLSGRAPQAAIGGGTIGNFTELNRNRPPAGSMALLAWPISPQVHSTDDLSLIENLQAQGDTVRTARSFAPAAHIAVGPICLHRRPDPYAAGKSGEPEPTHGDPRQRTRFGAAWTLGSIKYLAEAQADSLTYYETKGPFGVMGPDGVFPLYHVLKAVGQMKGAQVLRCTSTDPLAFDALAMRNGNRLRVMAACLLDEPVEVNIERLPDGSRTLRLDAYEVAILDYAADRRIG